MILIAREEPSHWYLRDGAPFYEVPRKKGGGMRPATLADARKVAALPSVTNILSVVAKPSLTAWRIEQGIMSALTLPKEDGENLEDFARRVAKDSTEQVDRAASIGSAAHAAIEAWATKQIPPPEALAPMLAPFMAWWRESVEAVGMTESTVFSLEEGYAGRLDAILKVAGAWGLYDFKTQTCAKGNPIFYETWPLQLEAYARAALDFNAVERVASIVIPTTPGKEGCHVKYWPERDTYWHIFKAARELWIYIKGYDPRTVQAEAIEQRRQDDPGDPCGGIMRRYEAAGTQGGNHDT